MSSGNGMSTDSNMKIGLAVIIVVLVILGWVSAFLGEMITPTGMPWTDFEALWAKVKGGGFAWPGAATWILIVLAVLAIVGAAFLSAKFGSNTVTVMTGCPATRTWRSGWARKLPWQKPSSRWNFLRMPLRRT